MRDFRFSCNVFALRSRADFADYCRAAETYGYDAVFTTDHLGAPSPFPPLVAAAEATERLRVGTLVLNSGFWNPHLLAREVATVDVLTGGRLELGLGAGHMKWEFDEAGIPWPALPERTGRLAATIDELARLFSGEGYPGERALREFYDLPGLAPAQRRGFGGTGPPLIVGGTGHRVLAVGAQRADTVSVAGAFQVPGQPPGTFRLGSATEADERVRFVREQAGDRFAGLELNVLIQAVVVTSDRKAEADRLAADRFPYFTAEQVLATPFLLIGTADEMAAQLRERRERFGFSFITVHEPYLTPFAPVIERIRADGAGPGPGSGPGTQ